MTKNDLKNVEAKGRMDGSPFHCGTCKSMVLQKEHVARFGVPGGEYIQVKTCTFTGNNRRSDFRRRTKIRSEFVILGMDIGFACHSEIRPLLKQAMAGKPDFICTLQRTGDEINPTKSEICQKENPGDHCLTFRKGKTCFFLAKKTDTGYQIVVETDSRGRAVEDS